MNKNDEICEDCGAKLDGDSVFCEQCGKKVTIEGEGKGKEVKVEEFSIIKKKWSKKTKIISIVIVLFLMILSGVIIADSLNIFSIGLFNDAPNVKIDSDVISGYAPLSVNFSTILSDIDGTISSYVWDFNDGETSNEKNPNHIFYERDKTYSVTIRVTDNMGEITVKTINISTLPNRPPNALIGTSTEEGVIPLSVKFEDLSTDYDGTIEKTSWKFGDGESSESQNPTHIYNKYGEYLVKLEVVDNEKYTSLDTVKITAKIPIVTKHDSELLDWMDETLDSMSNLFNSVNSGVSNLLIYTMDAKGRELMESAEEKIEEINKYSDLSQSFREIKSKFTIVLENYEKIGRSAWAIAYDLERYNYDFVQIGIECFSDELDDLTEALNDVTEIVRFIHN